MGTPWEVVTMLLIIIPVAAALYFLLLIGGMSPIAICVEGVGVIAAIRRGLAVARASIGTLIGSTLLLLATLLPAFLVFGLVVTGMGATSLPPTVLAVITIVLQSLLTAASTLLFIALWMTVFRQHTASPSGFSPTAP